MNFRTVVFIIGILIFVSCSNDNSTPDPTISEIQPESGPPGTIVTIMGNGFTDDLSGISVTFNEITADISSASENEIRATVPEEAESGPVTVTVGEVTANGPNFTVEAKAPGISSIEPDSGKVGTEVLITGMNFSITRSENIITFNGVQAPVKGFSETELLTEVPEGATDGPIEVTVGQKTATGPDFDVIEQPSVLRNKIVFTGLRQGEEEVDGDTESDYEIFVIDADGSNPQQLTDNLLDEGGASISPDGKHIAYSKLDESYDLFIMNADGSIVNQVTNDDHDNFTPSWSPDGSKLAFISNRDGNNEIFIMDTDGSDIQKVTDGLGDIYSPHWSPNSDKIVFSRKDGDNSDNDIFTINSDGTDLVQLTDNSSRDNSPEWSKDGTKIAFSSNRDGGNEEIYIMNADGSSETRITNNDQRDLSPTWSPDGTEIAIRGYGDGSYNIYKISSDGSGIRIRITQTSERDSSPSWSPVIN